MLFAFLNARLIAWSRSKDKLLYRFNAEMFHANTSQFEILPEPASAAICARSTGSSLSPHPAVHSTDVDQDLISPPHPSQVNKPNHLGYVAGTRIYILCV